MPLRLPALVALVLLAGCCGFFLLGSGERGSYDFQAFYCAGAAVRMHADPYRAQPLGACEHRQTGGTYAALAPGLVLPAPQPGYDIAGFAALSLLPFGMAKAVWGALLAAAIAIALYAVFRLTRESLYVILGAFAASLILPSFAFGELFAFFGAAACAAMLLADQERWTLAGIAAAACLVEPHLGLPLCAALALWKRETRLPMALSVCVLAGIAITVLGPLVNAEYFTAVLPLHALTEISSDAQLSLSAVLHAMHVPDLAAVRIGAASYVLVAGLGVYFGKVLADRLRSGAFLAATPAAFATLGGTFMHVTEIFAAVPLALLLIVRAPRQRPVLRTALVLLCIPWIAGVERGNALAFATLSALVAASLLWQFGGKRIAPAFAVAALTFAVLFWAPEWYARSAAASPAASAATTIDPIYAQASWQAWNRAALSSGSPAAWLLRLPTWIGLALLAASVGAVSRREAALSPAAARSTPSAR
ncbi:MAG TPA: glycosyltransferase 87 family protein [Candidatus Baltobacteraceae bacterium]|nr:glycosyltransferase 87 family protein [Candidatus Baltobacteraceae bacterium]